MLQISNECPKLFIIIPFLPWFGYPIWLDNIIGTKTIFRRAAKMGHKDVGLWLWNHLQKREAKCCYRCTLKKGWRYGRIRSEERRVGKECPYLFFIIPFIPCFTYPIKLDNRNGTKKCFHILILSWECISNNILLLFFVDDLKVITQHLSDPFFFSSKYNLYSKKYLRLS